jgi:YVTN family beta-propeller protein
MGCRPLNATRALIVLFGVIANAVHASPFVYVTQPTGIAVIDAATNSVTATIPAGDYPYAIAITRSGAHGYTADFASNTVTFLDLLGNNAMATLPVAAEPLALALSADETRLFVASRSARLTVIDIATRTTVAVVPLLDPAVALALHPDGRWLYVLYESATFVSVFDTTSNALSGTLANRLDLLPGGFALRASGAEIYVANQFMRSFFLPPPSDIVTVIDTAGVAPVASISVGEQVSAVTFGANPERFYVAASEHVKVIDPASRAVVDSIPVAAGYSPAIAYLPALHRLYLTSYSDNIVTVIDTAAAAPLTTIPVQGPGYLGVVPDASLPPPPANDGPKPAPAVPVTRPRKPVVAPRHPFTWTN